MWRVRPSETETTKKKGQVLLEGYTCEDDTCGGGGGGFGRTKSLTDEDLDELKGYDEIPELCNTLPALELCYSMSQRFLDEHQKSPASSPADGDVGESARRWLRCPSRIGRSQALGTILKK
ncbi:hypothetical protein QJS10_CPB18g00425 [Acorus calamus]|uniref:Uncharacterized protein n=1 Tax=Acorus calamus TaxID=4465 RepID=A0AAV9CNL1_ACOCL|nr:hypothetical protein QJS10_CPB18g00425 [Acorus calamus]